MRSGSNNWLKLYTSLLEHDGFGGMDDSARMLIVALWLYAARSGLHIFPNDPAWLARKIPMLNSKPDLGPLLDAKDCYCTPTPFICYCPSPKVVKGRSGGRNRSKSKRGRTTGTRVATRTRRARKRIEEREEREEKEDRREKKPLRVSRKKKRERKERVSTTATQKTEKQQTEALEPEKPENPMESEAGSALRHFLPGPARSVNRHSSPQSIGDIIGERFKDHWQDPDAESFGWEIVRALGYSDDPNNLETRSEWGAFASWWSKVKKVAPTIRLDELRATAIRKAEYLRTKGKSANNRGAVWFHIMNGELSRRGVTMTQPIRASPSR